MVTRGSITDIVILITITAIMIVTTVITKIKLLSGVTNFRTLYIFHAVIRTSRTERCEEHVENICTCLECTYLFLLLHF